MPAILSERPTQLTSFPKSFADLPAHHRFALALIAAHNDVRHEPTPRRVLLSYVSSTVGENSNPFVRRELPERLMAVLADLSDQSLMDTLPDGLKLSSSAEAARESWNGPFRELVSSLTATISAR
ncbi:hypothetical protein [Arthrobacter sp. efr-133-TYG-120]|uniref:hypothetical protein n=1 Tax=Arthrobacter sp. efr-133-TYG-120 TaxID=3040280 RepID=UPI002551A295|nr:hypothetical protein [Arthrobacter sp. efr-133-TYG-120]